MINFEKVEQSVRKLKHQVATGEIDQKTLKAHMMEMVDISADGYYWMFGHETETWYQHDGQQWIAKDPGNLRLLSPQDDDTADSDADNNPSSPSSQHDLKSQWQSINWTWFVISLIVIGLIAWVIFSSSLA